MINPLIFTEALSLKRNYGLDVLRTAAILLVIFCHGTVLLPDFLVSRLLAKWTGYVGVELFFVLSGYLIGTILLKLLTEESVGAPFSSLIGGFWIRRWFRTLPNYYLFLLIQIALVVSDASGWSHWWHYLGSYWRYFWFGQNLFWPMGDLMAVSWSLTIEEWFYLSFPLLIALFAWRLGRSVKAYFLTTLTYIILFTSLRVLMACVEYFNGNEHLAGVVGVRLDAIAYGALMMLGMKVWPSIMRRQRWWFMGLGLVGLTGACLLFNYELDHGLPPVLMASLITLTSLSLALLLPVAVYQTESSGMSKLRSAIAGISIISYSVYLLHSLVIYRVIPRWFDHGTWYYHYILYWILSLFLSFLVYTLFERRMTACREHFSRKRQDEP